MTSTEGVHLIDANTRLRFEKDHAVRRITQEVPASFLDQLKRKRDDSASAPTGEMHHVASIPVAIVEKWMAEGFNIFDKNINLKEIVKRLNSEDMAGFLVTNKRL